MLSTLTSSVPELTFQVGTEKHFKKVLFFDIFFGCFDSSALRRPWPEV